MANVAAAAVHDKYALQVGAIRAQLQAHATACGKTLGAGAWRVVASPDEAAALIAAAMP